VGRFTQPDPIGLLGGFNLYQYSPNSVGWADPLGLACSRDAKILRSNMIAAGKIIPNFKNAAHHIIMSNSNDIRMKWLKRKMNRLGIDINDADNGVFLPASIMVKNSSKSISPAHPTLHTEKYKQSVFNRLKGTTNKSDFEKELIKINKEIKNGLFPY
jgi:uncharacterized protein RhaS with RHS repeats